MVLTPETAEKKGAIAAALEMIAVDPLADDALRGFAYNTLEKIDQERFNIVLSEPSATVDALRTAASCFGSVARKKSSVSVLLGKEERELMRQPNMYFKLLTEVCLTHPAHHRKLLEESDHRTELDKLIDQILNVQKLTDPKDFEYMSRLSGIDETTGEKTLPDVRAQAITTHDLCNRMIDHVAENLNREINSGYDTVKVNVTVLEIMAAILERTRMTAGTSDNAESKEYAENQREMMEFGGMRLAIDIVGCKPAAPLVLVEAAINFGVEMLDGGNIDVQADALDYLSSGHSDQFFLNCREYLVAAEKAVQTERAQVQKGTEAFGDGYEKRQRFTMGLVEFLRLLMEGHNLPLQNLMRVQPENKKNFLLLADVVNLCATLAKDAQVMRGMPVMLVEYLEKLLLFLVEAAQGPCPGNQEFLACDSMISDVIKRVLTAPIYKPSRNETLGITYARVAACRLVSSIVEGTSQPNIFAALLKKFDKHFFRLVVTEKIYERLIGPEGGTQCEALDALRKKRVDRRVVHQEQKRADDAAARESAALRCRRGSTLRVQTTDEPAALRERERKAAETEYDQLLECGFEMMSVYMKLAARDEALARGITPDVPRFRNLKKRADNDEIGEELAREKAFDTSYRFLNSKIKRVEFEWHGGLHIAYFPLCCEAEALTPRMMAQLTAKVSIESPDLKKRDFLKVRLTW